MPLKLSIINSAGPGLNLKKKIGKRQNPASIKTNPGSSHNEVNKNPFAAT